MAYDFDRVSKLFGILRECRDLPEYKNIAKAATDELKHLEDKAETFSPETGKDNRPDPRPAIDSDTSKPNTEFTTPTLNKRV